MRTILAVLIVFMHSFTCYQGGWEQPAGFVNIPLYKWIARTSFAFTLEAFVFISGYLFAFQRISLKRMSGCINLIINKLKRLILPSFVFSALYFPLFYEYHGVGDLIYNLVNGCGHMWFLPMLFWCFLGCWLLEQIKMKDGWKLASLVVLNLLPIITLPLRLSNAFSFMVYFYTGFLCYKYLDKIKAFVTPKNLTLLWLAFVVFFVVFRPLCDMLVANESQSLYLRFLILSGNNICHLLYASTGLFAFYVSAVYYTQRHQLKPFTISFAACCFGIYIFQQFLLKILYYKTDFPTVVGPYWLPWCGFVIAIAISFVLSALLLKTKKGKFLIG